MLLPRWCPGRFRPRRRAWSLGLSLRGRWARFNWRTRRWGHRMRRLLRHHARFRLRGAGLRLVLRLRLASRLSFGSGLRLASRLSFGSGLRLASRLSFGSGLRLASRLSFGSGLRLGSRLSFGSGLRLGVNHTHGASLCRHHPRARECSGPWRRSNRRAALVLAGVQHRVASRGLLVLALHRCDGDVSLTDRCLFRRGRLGVNAAIAAVVADSIHGDVIDHGLVVDIGDVYVADIVYGAVVVQTAALPIAAFVAAADVAIAVIDPAVETDVRTPVAYMPDERSASPAPIAGGPQELRLRGEHPRARHPVVILVIVAPGPIPRRPNVSIAGNRGLLVDRQFGRWNTD